MPDRITENSRIPVGISSCLMGANVRYNGGHSQSKYCTQTLSQYFDFRQFCPEMAAGFGTPRPTLRLEGDPQNPRLAFTKEPGSDVKQQLMDASLPYIETLGELDGYILMKNSPSCGLERIKVHLENNHPHKDRRAGLFTEALMKRFPLLPVEEEARLNDAGLRENFILRVFAHHRFRNKVLAEPTYKTLLDFHSQYKYVLMAHNQVEYKGLGRLLAESSKAPVDELVETYFERFMTAISKPATRKNHTNVLLHLLGYLKQNTDSEIRQDILAVIEQYHRGEVNLATPVTLLYHYLRHNGSDYVKAQRYLEPYPASLGVRNDV